jgi:hypothetical protein
MHVLTRGHLPDFDILIHSFSGGSSPIPAPTGGRNWFTRRNGWPQHHIIVRKYPSFSILDPLTPAIIHLERGSVYIIMYAGGKYGIEAEKLSLVR